MINLVKFYQKVFPWIIRRYQSQGTKKRKLKICYEFLVLVKIIWWILCYFYQWKTFLITLISRIFHYCCNEKNDAWYLPLLKNVEKITEDFSQKVFVWRLWYWMIRQRQKIFRQLGRRQKHWETDSLDDWVTGWLSHWMTELLDVWVTGWLSHWMTESLDDWVTGWLSHWMTEALESLGD